MGVVVTLAGKQMMTGGAQKVDPRVPSSHARQGSCAGRRVDGVKLASGAIAASKRYSAPGIAVSGTCAAARLARKRARNMMMNFLAVLDGGDERRAAADFGQVHSPKQNP